MIAGKRITPQNEILFEGPGYACLDAITYGVLQTRGVQEVKGRALIR